MLREVQKKGRRYGEVLDQSLIACNITVRNCHIMPICCRNGAHLAAIKLFPFWDYVTPKSILIKRRYSVNKFQSNDNE